VLLVRFTADVRLDKVKTDVLDPMGLSSIHLKVSTLAANTMANLSFSINTNKIEDKLYSSILLQYK
jgi:hypothetical protein